MVLLLDNGHVVKAKLHFVSQNKQNQSVLFWTYMKMLLLRLFKLWFVQKICSSEAEVQKYLSGEAPSSSSLHSNTSLEFQEGKDFLGHCWFMETWGDMEF